MLASLAEEVESSFWTQESKINHSTMGRHTMGGKLRESAASKRNTYFIK